MALFSLSGQAVPGQPGMLYTANGGASPWAPNQAWGDPNARTYGWLAGQNPTIGGPSGMDDTVDPGAAMKNWFDVNPDDLAKLGWTPPASAANSQDPTGVFDYTPGTGEGESYVPGSRLGYSKGFQDLLNSKRIQSRIQQGESGTQQGFFGADGRQIGTGVQRGDGIDDAFADAMLAASLFTGGTIGLAGAAAEGGAAAGTAGGLTSEEAAAQAAAAASDAGGGSIAADQGLTAQQAFNYAKQANSLYNAANSAKNGNYLGAITGAVSAYAGLGGDVSSGVQTGLQGANAVDAASKGNYIGAASGGLGAYGSGTGDNSAWVNLAKAGVGGAGAVNAASQGNYGGALSGATGAYNNFNAGGSPSSYTGTTMDDSTETDQFGNPLTFANTTNYGQPGYFGGNPGLTINGNGLTGSELYDYGSGGLGSQQGSILDPNGGYQLDPSQNFGTGSYDFGGNPYAQQTGGATGGATDYGKLLSQLLGRSTQAGQGGGGPNTGSVGASLAALLGGLYSQRGGANVNTPNYQGAATSMGQSARTDQSNPYGSLSYKQTGTDAQGNPIYSQNVALTAPGASNLASAQQAQGTALGNWNDVLNSAGGDWSKIPGIYGDAGSQQALAQKAQDAMYEQQTRYLDPQYKQQQDALTSQLANQGVTMGSQAYTTAMDNFARQRDSAYGNARDSSINQGVNYGNTLFNQGVTAHNTGVSDFTTRLGTAGSAATTAGTNANSFNPSFASAPGSTNYLGAAALQGQGNVNQYNATTQANNSTSGGLFNLGGAVASNPSWTDLIGKFFSGGNGGNTAAVQPGP